MVWRIIHSTLLRIPTHLWGDIIFLFFFFWLPSARRPLSEPQLPTRSASPLPRPPPLEWCSLGPWPLGCCHILGYTVSYPHIMAGNTPHQPCGLDADSPAPGFMASTNAGWSGAVAGLAFTLAAPICSMPPKASSTFCGIPLCPGNLFWAARASVFCWHRVSSANTFWHLVWEDFRIFITVRLPHSVLIKSQP